MFITANSYIEILIINFGTQQVGSIKSDCSQEWTDQVPTLMVLTMNKRGTVCKTAGKWFGGIQRTHPVLTIQWSRKQKYI